MISMTVRGYERHSRSVISLITSLAIRRPAEAGTKAMLAGGLHEIQGVSVEKTVLREVMPRFFNSRRIMRAKGHTLVLKTSQTAKREGSSLLPVPIELIIGICKRCAASIKSSFELTVSIASTMYEHSARYVSVFAAFSAD